MEGEWVHFMLFDAGAELDLRLVERLLGRPVVQGVLVTRSAAPPHAAFPAPVEVVLPASDLGPAPPGATIEIRVHAVGAVVVRVRVPFQVESLRGMASGVRELRIGDRSLRRASEDLYRQVLEDLRPAMQETYEVSIEPERYVVHCITSGLSAQAAVQDHRRELAALITGEPDDELAPSIVDSALKHTVRYYEHEAVVMGWDHAVVVGRPDSYEDALDVMELANLELLEFRTYDAYLDHRLDASFHALDRLWAPGGFLRSARGPLREISALRVDFARITDNLHDTGKLFGDWYLAKLHQHLRDAFHLHEWERAVASKMETLEDMFHLAEEEANHRRALILEVMIVLLFVVDLAMILLLE